MADAETRFASAERSAADILAAFAAQCSADPVLKVVLESVGGYVLILNEHRQILAANDAVLTALQLREGDSILGLRPGEAFHCEHAAAAPSGCGTGEHCQTCGAVLAILAAQDAAHPVNGECFLTMRCNGSLEAVEFSVRCTPLHIHDQRVLVFVLHDISSQKRREVLERIFLHDLRNLAGGLLGWSEMLSGQNAQKAAKQIVHIAEMLGAELEGQELLVGAEAGTLQVQASPVPAEAVLRDTARTFNTHPVAAKRHFEVAPAPPDLVIRTDRTILLRVINNMVKNAFEATPPGGRVRLWCDATDGEVCFQVHNAGVIPPAVALQVFKRSFSTKSSHGRGLGTYSMKLLGEGLLGGRVTFVSSDKGGTSFRVSLPQDLPQTP